MARLLRGLSALLVSLCIATVLAQSIGLAWLWLAGRLNQDKLALVIAVLQGVDLLSLRADIEQKRDQQHSAQVSLADLARARAARMRDIELREQAMRGQFDVVRFEQAKLVDETDRYMKTRAAFQAELDALREGAVAEGEENTRLILENIRPAQAKDQLKRMVADGQTDQAVALLAAMPVTKRAKVVGEFKTDDEAAMLARLLELIREGVPERRLIDNTQQQLKQQQPPGA